MGKAVRIGNACRGPAHRPAARGCTDIFGLLYIITRTTMANREFELIVRRHESLKVITLIEAVVAMVPVTIATMF